MIKRVCLTVLFVVITSAPVCAAEKAGASTTMPSLRQAAGNRMLICGSLMSYELDDPRRAAFIAEQFNCLTPVNEMKPDALQKVKGKFTFERADKIVAFAEAHGMTMIGHTLGWHQQAPAWLFMDEDKKPLSREAALENLRNHIHTVVTHYKGRVKGWDVVNEGLDDAGPYLRDTPARKAIGDDYIIKAFQFAREADPDAELYYNDYNIEANYKRPKALRLLKELKDAGVKVDGVGIQGHWLIDNGNIKEIDEGIRAFADLGLKVMITELDVDPLPRRQGGADLGVMQRDGLDPYKVGLPDDVQQKLAARYRALFQVNVKHPQIQRVTFWGVDDGSSWLNDWPVKGRTNHPLLWDRNFQPKPALRAVIETLQQTS
jgi:endo-1,4-beta-xylanase